MPSELQRVTAELTHMREVVRDQLAVNNKIAELERRIAVYELELQQKDALISFLHSALGVKDPDKAKQLEHRRKQGQREISRATLL